MSAKDLVVRAITSQEAGRVVREVHYSGKVVQNSTLHLGVFMAGRLCGAMQFGSPLDRRKVLPLVRGTEWNQMLELNRMAFDERLPRNAESRALGVAFRMLRKHRPDIKWILSFSDATQCGDGAIYRASGFVLTGIRENNQVWRMPDGTLCARTVFLDGGNGGGILKRRFGYVEGEGAIPFLERIGATVLPGYQLRYIRFLDPAWVDRLTVPVIPFSQIPDDARMYRGERVTRRPVEAAGHHPEEGGADPTPALHSTEAPDA